MKTSVNYNSIAWLSQYDTGDISFVPLGQSSSFELSVERTVHKGIGSKNKVDYYRYKDNNVGFNLTVYANQERGFGTQLSRTNMATENYVSGEITGYGLSGCVSALYDLVNHPEYLLHFYSVVDDVGDVDLALKTGDYSGYFLKFEDCKIENYTFQASVGSMVSIDTQYIADDVLMLRTGLEYISGINVNYQAVRPSDVIVYVSAGTGAAQVMPSFNADSLSIELPIQYKILEKFGASKPCERKIMLPVLGKVVLEGLPAEFNSMAESLLETEDGFFTMTVLVRAKNLRATGASTDDYMAIVFPKLYLEGQGFSASVGSRLRAGVTFSFFEYGCEYQSGDEGLFFLRKIPEEILYFDP